MTVPTKVTFSNLCLKHYSLYHAPMVVGVWIGGAYWFTSSTSLANLAVPIARSFTDSFAGIEPESVPLFIVMQLIGLAIALPVIAALMTSKDT